MERSLTVLLPVHNAQATLRATVHEILDVVPELTRRFDVLIVDDGSTDATSEVAQELARYYPQVRVVYRSTSAGRDDAVRAGLEESRGDVVLLRDEEAGISLHGLHKLWQTNDDRHGSRDQAAPSGGLGELRSYARKRSRRAGFRILRPATAARDQQPTSYTVASEPGSGKPGRPNYLARLKKFALGE